MPDVEAVVSEITSLTNFLVEKGFANDQNYPIRRYSRGSTYVTFSDARPTSSMFKGISYEELYGEQLSARS